MARRDEEKTEVIVTVPLRRLLTGVPRTKRAAAAIPRIKRYVRRHVDPRWLEAVATDDEPDGKLWIDDSLNMTIWRRGREHVAGPAEWEEPKGGGTPRLTKRTSVRYGSVLKVRAYFNEEPKDGSDPRIELTLPGVEHVTRQEKRDRRREGTHEHDDGEEGAQDEGEEGASAGDGDGEGDEEAPEEEEPAKPASSKAGAATGAPKQKKKKATKEEGED